jgi:hypothetical protein
MVRYQNSVIPMTPIRIETGTPEGDAMGFSADCFSGWLEIVEKNRIYLHFIISRCRNEGNTQALIRKWLAKGFDVRVVMPRPVMQHILRKLLFVPARESIPEHYDGEIDIWRRPAITDIFIPVSPEADVPGFS